MIKNDTAPHRSTAHHATPQHSTPHHITPHHITSHHITPHHITQQDSTLYITHHKINIMQYINFMTIRIIT